MVIVIPQEEVPRLTLTTSKSFSALSLQYGKYTAEI